MDALQHQKIVNQLLFVVEDISTIEALALAMDFLNLIVQRMVTAGDNQGQQALPDEPNAPPAA